MSNFLNSIGLGNIDLGIVVLILLVMIIVLFVLNIINMNKIKKQNERLGRFMKGKVAKSLETEIVGLFEDNTMMKTSIDKNRRDIADLYSKFVSAVSKVGIVKYDAFSQMGGKLSFCLCMLDESNNGYILNSVHSTEGNYTYIKDIRNGKCKLDLGDEEVEALDQAMSKEV